MSIDQERWLLAITKLIQITQKGELKWSIWQHNKTESESIRYGTHYVASHLDSRLLIFYKRSKHLRRSPSLLSIASSNPLLTPPSDNLGFIWRREYILEFVSETYETIHQTESIDAIQDLYKAAEYQVSGVSKFIDRLLS